MSARKVLTEIPIRKKRWQKLLRRQQNIEGKGLSNDGDLNLNIIVRNN